MNTAAACRICNDNSHISSECPDLRDSLNEGFYSGSGSGGDCEEEDSTKNYPYFLVLLSISYYFWPNV